MKSYPLKSLTIAEAQEMQFRLVDEITKVFPGNEILTRGDLGVVKGLNQPVYTRNVEKVIANFFNTDEALLVRGSGTNAIRLALHVGVNRKKKILIHDAPIYPTTNVSFEMLGITYEKVDFNDLAAVKDKIKDEEITSALVQVTRQLPSDSYEAETVIKTIKELRPDIFVITDDNYSVFKTEKIGVQYGADISCFSTFKLLGPEGIGCVVGNSEALQSLKKENYSGGGQVQGHEALDVLKGMIYVPVSQAISAKVGEEVCESLNQGTLEAVKEASIVNAQSRVLIVELKEPIAEAVIEEATKLGALPYPVGAESQYEFCPLFYRVSGTFRNADPTAEKRLIRINPNRSGAKNIIIILKESIEKVKE